ncbi:hypothetical protein HK101_010714 [Irineochytrium annulatum]|nr:hypothetical protein HK101_010714 [Irineochytrium annulatum]
MNTVVDLRKLSRFGPQEIAFLSLMTALTSAVTNLILVERGIAIFESKRRQYWKVTIRVVDLQTATPVTKVQGLWGLFCVVFASVGLYGFSKKDKYITRIWCIWFFVSSFVSVAADWASFFFAVFVLKGCVPDLHNHCKNLPLLRFAAFTISAIHSILAVFFCICVRTYWMKELAQNRGQAGVNLRNVEALLEESEEETPLEKS